MMALVSCGFVTFFIGFVLVPWILYLIIVLYILEILSHITMVGRSILCCALVPCCFLRKDSSKTSVHKVTVFSLVWRLRFWECFLFYEIWVSVDICFLINKSMMVIWSTNIIWIFDPGIFGYNKSKGSGTTCIISTYQDDGEKYGDIRWLKTLNTLMESLQRFSRQSFDIRFRSQNGGYNQTYLGSKLEKNKVKIYQNDSDIDVLVYIKVLTFQNFCRNHQVLSCGV